MKKKNTFLIKLSYLLSIEDDETSKQSELKDKIINKISNDLRISINENKDVLLKWEETSNVELDPEIINCGKCDNCGGWVTDREKTNPIEGLCNGARVNGRLLCDECLPSDHRWAF